MEQRGSGRGRGSRGGGRGLMTPPPNQRGVMRGRGGTWRGRGGRGRKQPISGLAGDSGTSPMAKDQSSRAGETESPGTRGRGRGRGRGAGRGGASRTASSSPASQKQSPVVSERKRSLPSSRSSSPATSDKSRVGPSAVKLTAPILNREKKQNTTITMKSVDLSRDRIYLKEGSVVKLMENKVSHDPIADTKIKGKSGRPKGAKTKKMPFQRPKKRKVLQQPLPPSGKANIDDEYDTETEETFIGADPLDETSIEYQDSGNDVTSIDESIPEEPVITKKKAGRPFKKITDTIDDVINDVISAANNDFSDSDSGEISFKSPELVKDPNKKGRTEFISDFDSQISENTDSTTSTQPEEDTPPVVVKRKPGRPFGSKNKFPRQTPPASSPVTKEGQKKKLKSLKDSTPKAKPRVSSPKGSKERNEVEKTPKKRGRPFKTKPEVDTQESLASPSELESELETTEEVSAEEPEVKIKRKPGRPPGSPNKSKNIGKAIVARALKGIKNKGSRGAIRKPFKSKTLLGSRTAKFIQKGLKRKNVPTKESDDSQDSTETVADKQSEALKDAIDTHAVKPKLSSVLSAKQSVEKTLKAGKKEDKIEIKQTNLKSIAKRPYNMQRRNAALSARRRALQSANKHGNGEFKVPSTTKILAKIHEKQAVNMAMKKDLKVVNPRVSKVKKPEIVISKSQALVSVSALSPEMMSRQKSDSESSSSSSEEGGTSEEEESRMSVIDSKDTPTTSLRSVTLPSLLQRKQDRAQSTKSPDLVTVLRDTRKMREQLAKQRARRASQDDVTSAHLAAAAEKKRALEDQFSGSEEPRTNVFEKFTKIKELTSENSLDEEEIAKAKEELKPVGRKPGRPRRSEVKEKSGAAPKRRSSNTSLRAFVNEDSENSEDDAASTIDEAQSPQKETEEEKDKSEEEEAETATETEDDEEGGGIEPKTSASETVKPPRERKRRRREYDKLIENLVEAYGNDVLTGSSSGSDAPSGRSAEGGRRGPYTQRDMSRTLKKLKLPSERSSRSQTKGVMESASQGDAATSQERVRGRGGRGRGFRGQGRGFRGRGRGFGGRGRGFGGQGRGFRGRGRGFGGQGRGFGGRGRGFGRGRGTLSGASMSRGVRGGVRGAGRIKRGVPGARGRGASSGTGNELTSPTESIISARAPRARGKPPRGKGRGGWRPGVGRPRGSTARGSLWSRGLHRKALIGARRSNRTTNQEPEDSASQSEQDTPDQSDLETETSSVFDPASFGKCSPPPLEIAQEFVDESETGDYELSSDEAERDRAFMLSAFMETESQIHDKSVPTTAENDMAMESLVDTKALHEEVIQHKNQSENPTNESKIDTEMPSVQDKNLESELSESIDTESVSTGHPLDESRDMPELSEHEERMEGDELTRSPVKDMPILTSQVMSKFTNIASVPSPSAKDSDILTTVSQNAKDDGERSINLQTDLPKAARVLDLDNETPKSVENITQGVEISDASIKEDEIEETMIEENSGKSTPKDEEENINPPEETRLEVSDSQLPGEENVDTGNQNVSSSKTAEEMNDTHPELEENAPKSPVSANVTDAPEGNINDAVTDNEHATSADKTEAKASEVELKAIVEDSSNESLPIETEETNTNDEMQKSTDNVSTANIPSSEHLLDEQKEAMDIESMAVIDNSVETKVPKLKENDTVDVRSEPVLSTENTEQANDASADIDTYGKTASPAENMEKDAMELNAKPDVEIQADKTETMQVETMVDSKESKSSSTENTQSEQDERSVIQSTDDEGEMQPSVDDTLDSRENISESDDTPSIVIAKPEVTDSEISQLKNSTLEQTDEVQLEDATPSEMPVTEKSVTPTPSLEESASDSEVPAVPDTQIDIVQPVPDNQITTVQSVPDTQTDQVQSVPDTKTDQVQSVPDTQTDPVHSVPVNDRSSGVAITEGKSVMDSTVDTNLPMEEAKEPAKESEMVSSDKEEEAVSDVKEAVGQQSDVEEKVVETFEKDGEITESTIHGSSERDQKTTSPETSDQSAADIDTSDEVVTNIPEISTGGEAEEPLAEPPVQSSDALSGPNEESENAENTHGADIENETTCFVKDESKDKEIEPKVSHFTQDKDVEKYQNTVNAARDEDNAVEGSEAVDAEDTVIANENVIFQETKEPDTEIQSDTQPAIKQSEMESEQESQTEQVPTAVEMILDNEQTPETKARDTEVDEDVKKSEKDDIVNENQMTDKLKLKNDTENTWEIADELDDITNETSVAHQAEIAKDVDEILEDNKYKDPVLASETNEKEKESETELDIGNEGADMNEEKTTVQMETKASEEEKDDAILNSAAKSIEIVDETVTLPPLESDNKDMTEKLIADDKEELLPTESDTTLKQESDDKKETAKLESNNIDEIIKTESDNKDKIAETESDNKDKIAETESDNKDKIAEAESDSTNKAADETEMKPHSETTEVTEVNTVTSSETQKVSAWEKSRRKKQMRKLRGKKLAERAQARAKQRAEQRASASPEKSTEDKEGAERDTATPEPAEGKKRGKRSEVELLFDIGPPSKAKRQAAIPESEKRTILGQRIETGSRRQQVKRKRQYSETSLSSADMDAAMDTEAAKHVPGSEAAAKPAPVSQVPESAPDAMGKQGLEKEVKAVDTSKFPGASTAAVQHAAEDTAAVVQIQGSSAGLDADAEDLDSGHPDLHSSPESDSGKKMTTRGKKNRFWYLFAKQDRKGNMKSMLSKPANADMSEYEEYRQSAYAKKPSDARPGAPLSPRSASHALELSPTQLATKSKSHPGTPVGSLDATRLMTSAEDVDMAAEHLIGQDDSSSHDQEIQQYAMDASSESQPKVPKLVLKIPKKHKKEKSQHHHHKAAKPVRTSKQYPTISPVEVSPETMAERDTPPLISKIKLPSKSASSPVTFKPETEEGRDSRMERLTRQCKPCYVKLVDLIKFLKMTGNEDMIPEIPPPSTNDVIDDEEIALDKEEDTDLTSRDDDKQATKSVAMETTDAEPPIITQTACTPNITPPKTAYEKQFMSFIDQKRHLGPYLGPSKVVTNREERKDTVASTHVAQSRNKEKSAVAPSSALVKLAPKPGTVPATYSSLSSYKSATDSPLITTVLPHVAGNTSSQMLLIPVTSTMLQTSAVHGQIQSGATLTSAANAGTTSHLSTPASHASSQSHAAQRDTPHTEVEDLTTRGKGPVLPKLKSPSPTTTISARALTEKVQQSDMSAATSLIKGMIPSKKTARKQSRSAAANANNTAASTPTQAAASPGGTQQSAAIPQRYRCLCCTYTCSSKTVMAEHIYNHTDIVPYSCGYCGSIFGTKSGVTVHTKRDHKNQPHKIVKNSRLEEEQYFCTIDDYERMAQRGPVPLKTVDKMSKQNTVATPKPEVPKEMLDSLYSSKQSLKLPKNLSTTEAKYQCKFCEFHTVDKHTMELHVSHSHQKERRFVCPFCKVSFFKQVEMMKKHITKWHPGGNADNIEYEPGYYQPIPPVVTSKASTHSAAMVHKYSGATKKKQGTARKSAPTKRKAGTELGSHVPAKTMATHTTRVIAPALNKALAKTSGYVNILPKLTGTVTTAGPRFQNLPSGQHIILNVPYSTVAPPGANQILVGGANQNKLTNQKTAHQKTATGLRIENVVSLKDQHQKAELSSVTAKQNKELVKEKADSQTPERENTDCGPALDISVTSERDTSPEYMCKEISSTSTEEIPDLSKSQNPPSEGASNIPGMAQRGEYKLPPNMNTGVKGSDSGNTAAKLLTASQKQTSEGSKTKAYQCKICSKYLLNFETATRHINKNHYMDFDYQCPYCKYKCTNKELKNLMPRHLATDHANRPQEVHIGLVNQDAYFKAVEVDSSLINKGQSPTGKRFGKTSISPAATALSKTGAAYARQQHAHGKDAAVVQLAQRAGQGTVIIQQDEPAVINVAGTTLESDDQPLDFSVKDRSRAASHVTSQHDTGVLDLSKPFRAGQSASLTMTSSASTPRPPPLRPMGIVDASQMSQKGRQAPPLTRAPVPGARQSRVPSRDQGAGNIGNKAQPMHISGETGMEEGDSSSEDEEEMAKECYGVFNIQPPQGLVAASVGYRPVNVPHMAVVSNALAPQPSPAHLMTSSHDLSLNQYRLAGARAHQMPITSAHYLAPHISTPPHLARAIPGLQIRGRTPPPNVVVGGPALNFSQAMPKISLISCPYCGYKDRSYDAMRSHILRHDQVEWTCPYCPVAHKMAKPVVEQHIRACHPGARVNLVPYGLHPENLQQ